jgi:hypothetical protein
MKTASSGGRTGDPSNQSGNLVGAARFELATPSLPGAGRLLILLTFLGNRAFYSPLKSQGFLFRLPTKNQQEKAAVSARSSVVGNLGWRGR